MKFSHKHKNKTSAYNSHVRISKKFIRQNTRKNTI